MTNLKTIMTNAWKIARETAAQQGGSPRHYLAYALGRAWAESRQETVFEVTGKTYDLRKELVSCGFKFHKAGDHALATTFWYGTQHNVDLLNKRIAGYHVKLTRSLKVAPISGAHANLI